MLVIVVTWNSAAVIGSLLDSLGPGLDGLAWRLVVVDNASSDETVALVTAHEVTSHVIQTGHNSGYSAAINAGMSLARSDEAVLVLNPDVRLAAGAGQTLVSALDEDGVGICVPRQLSEAGEVLYTLRRDPTVLRIWGEAILGGYRAGRFEHLGEVVVDPRAYRRPGPCDWATGSAMLISPSCRIATGDWDEGFFLYSEETEYAQRARSKGYALRYCPDAVVTHKVGASHTSNELWSLLVVNRFRLYGRSASSISAALYFMGLLLGEVLRSPRGRTHRAAVKALLSLQAGRRPGA